MKTVGIVSIFAILAVLIYVRMKMIYDRVTFEFGFRGADLSDINLTDILSSGKTEATIKVALKIVNKNNFDINFRFNGAWLEYAGDVIASTTEATNGKSVLVPANSAAEMIGDVIITLNKTSVMLIKSVLLRQAPFVDYTVKLNMFGLNFTWKDYFKWEL